MIHVYKFNFFEENYYKYRTLLKTNVRKAKIMTRKLTFNIPSETAGAGITPGYTQFNITSFNRYEIINHSLENDFICQDGGWYLISNIKDTSNASGEIYLNGIVIDTVQTSGQWERSDRLIILKRNDIISANNISKQYSVIQGYYKLTGNTFMSLIKYQ